MVLLRGPLARRVRRHGPQRQRPGGLGPDSGTASNWGPRSRRTPTGLGAWTDSQQKDRQMKDPSYQTAEGQPAAWTDSQQKDSQQLGQTASRRTAEAQLFPWALLNGQIDPPPHGCQLFLARRPLVHERPPHPRTNLNFYFCVLLGEVW